jgi:hypothetical protein
MKRAEGYTATWLSILHARFPQVSGRSPQRIRVDPARPLRTEDRDEALKLGKPWQTKGLP